MAPSSSPPSDSPLAKGGESVVAAVLAEDERASGLAHDALVAGLNGTVSEVVKRRLDELYSGLRHQTASDNRGSHDAQQRT